MSNNTNIFVIKKKKEIKPFYVKFDQEYVDFSEVEHNWYFDWNQCSGYLTADNYIKNNNSEIQSTSQRGFVNIGWDSPGNYKVDEILFLENGDSEGPGSALTKFYVDRFGKISGHINVDRLYGEDYFEENDLHIKIYQPKFKLYIINDSFDLTEFENYPGNTEVLDLHVMLNAKYDDPETFKIIQYDSFPSNINIKILTLNVSEFVDISESGKIKISDKCPVDQIQIKFTSGNKVPIIKTIDIIREISHTEGFTITNSEIDDVNGYYHEVKVEGINREDYDSDEDYLIARLQYLIDHQEINDNDVETDPIYTNGKCYIYKHAVGDYFIIPKGGSNICWYYRNGGGATLLNEFEYNYDIWYWKDDPFNDLSEWRK